MSCHKAKSSTCSDKELQIFKSFGNAHQVQVLGRLVLTTAREGTQQFIKNIFSSLAGRLVFDVYKNNSDPSGISGSDTELMQEDQSLINLNSDVDMVPKQRSMQGEVSFCVTFRTSQDAHGTSVYAVFVKSDIVLGTVEMVFSSICLYGHKIPGASSSDWGNVIFKVHHGIHLWSRKLFNYPDDREVAVMVKTPSLLETLCKDMSCHKANSSTCNDEELQRFESFGNAQQVQFLGLLVFAVVRVGTQQFVKNIFSSAGRLVFDAYKNNSDTSGISGSDTELMQEDQPLLQWLHGNLNSDFNMTPKQRSMQGEVPFCVASSPSQDVHVTSVYAIFVKSDIVLGNVEMVFSSVYLYGCKIPGASSCGWGNVIFKAHHDIHLGSRILFYYPDDKEVVVMVKTPNLFEILCKDIRCHKANSSTCSEERQRFESFGNAQQVQFLGLLVFAAAREDAQQFIKNTFPSSAGKLVFDACKDSQPLPEVRS
ncbi:uncharacterized protein [Pocillopora verrucosa]|uniref:uncharacterized protein n=1 Tax=Pocillopora verrucosa TaxID=203993 RepID=UPI0033406112